MRVSNFFRFIINNTFLILVLFFFAVISCKKETEIVQNIDYNVIYEIDTIPVYQTAADKTKQKTSTQYTSILYADLFKKSISGIDLDEISQLSLSVGDKQLVNEMIIGNYMKTTGVVIPTSADMKSNIDKFIDDTYIRFYLRKPTELEKYYLKNIISSDTSVTPEVVYTAFSLSNEYLFY